jgi:hypothetical protein
MQQVVILFGEQLSQLAKAGLTHTYHHMFPLCEHEKINYLVLG